MKLVLISMASVLVVSQAHAGECTFPKALKQAELAMKAELEGQLPVKAKHVFTKLKGKVLSSDYERIQEYNKPFGAVAAIQIEARLAIELQNQAKQLDSTASCSRETRYLNGSPRGVIHWVCNGKTVDLELKTNDGAGQFSVVVDKKGGSQFFAPIFYTHRVVIAERYNKMEALNVLSSVLFPADETGGNVASSDIRLDNFNELGADLAKANQSCD